MDKVDMHNKVYRVTLILQEATAKTNRVMEL